MAFQPILNNSFEEAFRGLISTSTNVVDYSIGSNDLKVAIFVILFAAVLAIFWIKFKPRH